MINFDLPFSLHWWMKTLNGANEELAIYANGTTGYEWCTLLQKYGIKVYSIFNLHDENVKLQAYGVYLRPSQVVWAEYVTACYGLCIYGEYRKEKHYDIYMYVVRTGNRIMPRRWNLRGAKSPFNMKAISALAGILGIKPILAELPVRQKRKRKK